MDQDHPGCRVCRGSLRYRGFPMSDDWEARGVNSLIAEDPGMARALEDLTRILPDTAWQGLSLHDELKRAILKQGGGADMSPSMVILKRFHELHEALDQKNEELRDLRRRINEG